MRTCIQCGQEKPASEFYRHPTAASGRRKKCRSCLNEAARVNRLKNIEHYRAYERARSKR